MRAIGPSSLTTRTLLLLGAAVGGIIIVAGCVTYYFVFRAVEERALVHLRQYGAERVQLIENELAEIPRNLHIAADAYVRRYKKPDPPDFLKRWDHLFAYFPDGCWRSKKEYSSDYEYSPLWVHKDVGPSPDDDFKRRILIMEEVCHTFQPGWVHDFRSLYGFTNDKQAVIGFDPALAGWIYYQPADYPVNTEEFGYMATRAANPQRKMVWTGTTSNQGNNASLVSIVLPIELDGRHVMSVGHDMLVGNLIGETQRLEVPGMKHMIFRDDGRMIACPGRAKEIFDGQGRLNMKTAGDPVWKALFTAIEGRKGRDFADYEPATDLHFVVRRLAGPDWIYLTTMPRSLLREQAFQSTQWVLWTTLASLVLELMLLGVILQRSIADPVRQLVVATRKLAAGETGVVFDFTRKDELGQLASAFNHMVGRVGERDAALREEKASLEARVAERTSELAAALQQQTELAKLKTDFVSLVSHEFRTPLGVIMSAVDVLRRYFERLSPEKRDHHLEMIFNSTRNLAGLIEEVLLLGRVEEGRLQFSPAPLDLEKFCRVLTDEVVSATAAECRINFTTEGDLGDAMSDEALLRHIIPNLLSNAVKYSEPGGGVEFHLRRDGSDAVLVVRDHGIGIPREDQARLFASFTRGSNLGTRPGTGLGLVIVQRCVRLHNGAIHLESEPGTGTVVTVRLPVWRNPSLTKHTPP